MKLVVLYCSRSRSRSRSRNNSRDNVINGSSRVGTAVVRYNMNVEDSST